MKWVRSRRYWRLVVATIGVVLVGAFVVRAWLPGPRHRGVRGSRPALQVKGADRQNTRTDVEGAPIDALSAIIPLIESTTLIDPIESPNEPTESTPLVPVRDPGNSERPMRETWTRFRGPLGQGISDDTQIPTQWSDASHVKWRTALPGPGASSPVLSDEFVFLTTYSGYGVGRNAGSTNNLKRELHCIDRSNGKLMWSKTAETVLPEDPYQGMGLPEHGYATNTPVTDGNRVYAFFGKSGVYGYDVQGNEQWRVSVGTESGNRGWGTGASLLLYQDLVIVNAAEESQSIYGINKHTGKIEWTAPGGSLELCYGTPSLVHVNDERDDLVIAVPGEVWGLNPSTGKLVWYVETKLTGNLAPSVIVDGNRVYVFGGYRSSGSLALRVDADCDANVTKSHVLWTGRNSSYVATPVFHQGRLYWIDDRGQYFCINASDGEVVHKARVPGIDTSGRPVYASPICIHGRIYAQSRTSGMYVLEPGDTLKVLATNKFASDDSVFNATPAVSNGQLFVRSDKYLYCIAND